MLTSQSSFFFSEGPLFHDSRSRGWASVASMQTSTTTSRPTTVLGFFHDDLLNNFDIGDPITEGIDDFDVLDV
jgi:hypothetical protein